jgi:hypothetical protein
MLMDFVQEVVIHVLLIRINIIDKIPGNLFQWGDEIVIQAGF